MLAQRQAVALMVRSLLRRMLTLLIITNSLLVSLVALTQNIDTQRPILREVSGLADGSLFGYSLVLHQTLANPPNMDEAISGVR